MLVEKDRLEKMARGQLNLLECRAVAESILASYMFEKVESNLVEAPVSDDFGGQNKYAIKILTKLQGKILDLKITDAKQFLAITDLLSNLKEELYRQNVSQNSR